MGFINQSQQLHETTTKGERIWLAFYDKSNHSHNNHCTCLICSMQSGCCWSSFEVQVWKVANKVFLPTRKFNWQFCNLASKYFLAYKNSKTMSKKRIKLKIGSGNSRKQETIILERRGQLLDRTINIKIQEKCDWFLKNRKTD